MKSGGRGQSLLLTMLLIAAMMLLPQRAWAARYDTSDMPTRQSGSNLWNWNVYTIILGDDDDTNNYYTPWIITPGEAISSEQQQEVFSVYTGTYERYAELHGSATLTLQGPVDNTRKIHKVAISGLQAIDSKEETISGTITVTLKKQDGSTVATFTQDSRPDYYNCYNLAEPVEWDDNNYVEISFSGCEVKFSQLNVIDGEELSASKFSWPSELTDISNPTLSTENGTTLTYTGASGSFEFPLMYDNEVFTYAYYTSSAPVAYVGYGEIGEVTVYNFGSTTITAEVGDDDFLPLSFSYTLNVVPAAGTFNLFVADVQVTSDNASNITSQYLKSGTASFDAATNTLTLNNDSIGYGGIQSGLENLTIVFNGTNVIESYIGANTAVAGTHSLTLQSGTEGSSISFKNPVDKCFIDGFDNISMDGLYISSEYPWAYDSAAKRYVQAHLPKGYILQEATITSVPHYSLWIGGTQLTDENKADVFSGHNTLDGKVSFDSSTNTLSLNGAEMQYNVFSNLNSLTINVSGECTIGGGDSATAVRTAVPSTLTLKSTGSGNKLTFNNERCIRDFSSLTLSGLYWDDNYTYGDGPVDYWDSDAQQEIHTTGKQLLNTSGTEVGNAVASSEIEFRKEFMCHNYDDGVYTIGFEGNGEIHYSIDYADPELTDVENAVYEREDNVYQIVLEGPCTFTAWKVVGTAQSTPITAKLFGFAETELTMVKDATDEALAVIPALDGGMSVEYSVSPEILTISEGTLTANTYGTAIISGMLDIGNNELGYVILNNESDNGYMLDDITVSIVPAAPTFSLSPDEKYRGDQSLELSTTAEGGVIKYFIGKYQDNDNPQTYTEAITLTESTSVTAWVEVSVESEAATTGAQTVKSEVVTKEFNITPIVKYGITVYPLEGAPVQVNEDNSADVLGNGTVQFDGRSRLVLNGAQLTKILVGSSAQLPEDGLEIYLEGANTITNTELVAIQSEIATHQIPLSFLTAPDASGSLTYNYTGSDATLTDDTNLFTGFSVTYKNNLVKAVDFQNNKATIAIPLQLIVETTEENEDYSFNTSPAGSPTAKLDNFVYDDKVLFTIDDDGTAGSADGFDGSLNAIVINSVMTDTEVKNTDNLIPGTPDYASAFKGLTFIVPAGKGVITLNIHTESGFAFHVRIGEQTPVEVVNANGYADVEVPFACSMASYVKVYLVSTTTPAPAYDGHRAGPKASVSGGIGGLKVSSSSIVTPSVDPAAAYLLMDPSSDIATDGGSKHGGIVVNNANVTDLPDDAFSSHTSASYIDLRGTKITGKHFSRVGGAFYGVNENTLIYLPAGNTATGANFIIGGICDDMKLDNTASYFEAAANFNFTAAKADFNRSFSTGTDARGNASCYTVFLPYAIQPDKANGKFYTFTGYNASTGTVDLNAVDTPAANTAYIFQPAGDGAMKPMLSVEVSAAGSTASPDDSSESDGLYGVYEEHTWPSAPDGIYCFVGEAKDGLTAGQFAKVGADTHIRPFRAYLRIASTSAPEFLSVDWGNGTTSIVPLDKSQVEQSGEGWWTITGFRLPSKPTEKGVYIHNNKKVVVK